MHYVTPSLAPPKPELGLYLPRISEPPETRRKGLATALYPQNARHANSRLMRRRLPKVRAILE